MAIAANDELVQALRALLNDGGPAARGAAAHVLAEHDMKKPQPRRRNPPPAIAGLCSCGAVMNGEHWPGCKNGKPTASQESLKSRRKAQESGWVRMEALLSPVQSRKLDLLAEIHGSRRKALAYLIDQS